MQSPAQQGPGTAENALRSTGVAARDSSWFGIDFPVYWQTVRKRWNLVAITAAVSLAAVFVWTYRQPKIYEGATALVIDPMAPQVLQGVKDVVELGTGSYFAQREFYETQFRIIRSRQVIERVVSRLGLAADPNFPYTGAAKEMKNRDVVAIVTENTKVVPIRESRIANIVVQDRDPSRAAQIANAIADAYREGNLEFKLEGAREATTFLGDQVVELTEKLKRSEMALYDFKKRHQLDDVNLDDKQNMTTQNLQTYNQKLADLRSRRIELEATRKLIIDARDNIEERESLPDVRENVVIQQLRVQFVDLAKARAELETKYGDKHPALGALDRKLKSVRNDYELEITNILRAHDKRYKAILENEKALVALMENERRKAIELARLEVEYRPLVREAENDNKLYSQILQRQKETGLTGLIRSNNVRILDRAEANPKPVKPQLLLNLGLALLVGLTLGVSAAFVVESLDNTVKTLEQAESVLGVPVLGMVPIIGERKGRKVVEPQDQQSRDLGVFRDSKSAAAEACRSIRTNLMFLSPDERLRSIVVTSPGPLEGKTTTAISLAITMATAGQRVLLIDTDLRRPRIHKGFGLANKSGISNVIVGDAKLEDVAIHSEVPNLDLLLCGPLPPNPAELLHTKRFAEIMSECEEKYDFVIYDSPPTSAVTDPAVIANRADGVVLVIRASQTTRAAAAFARRQLADAKARILGAVVNRVDPTDQYYTYYYARYYRGYGYGGEYRADSKA